MAVPANDLHLISHNSNETRAFGALLGRHLRTGDLVLLAGGIGAGKTTFAQGLAIGLGVETDVVSPTFTIVMEHEFANQRGLACRLYHIDLYRLEGGDDDLSGIGLEEYLDNPEAVTVVEWPERMASALPAEYIIVEFIEIGETERQLHVTLAGARYQEVMDDFRRQTVGEHG